MIPPLASESVGLVLFLIYAGPPLLLLLLGLIVGGTTERRHFASIRRRERELAGLVVTDLKTFPKRDPHGPVPMMVSGEAVIATDYLKSFLASIRNIFGGEVRSYQSLADRAHREAVLRMLEAAHRAGFNAVCNVRVATADLNGGAQARAAMLEVFAYGTAYRAVTSPTGHE